jgi:polyhydroxyalkanoate synthesis regulator phasin
VGFRKIQKGVGRKTKRPLTDEELKAKVLDRFKKKLKGLTESQKDDVIRKAHKELIDNGALDFEDFKKIIARVVGRGELTIEEANRMKELVKTTNELEDYAQKAREQRTPESFKAYKEQQIKTARAARDLNEMFLNKPDIIRRITGIMQLNTLGIVSLINNPVYNIMNQSGVRFPIGVLNDVSDRVIKLVKKDFEQEHNVFETQLDFWEMVGVGGKEAATQLLTGLNRSDYIQKELYSEQIRPFKALRDLHLWAKGKKQLSKRQAFDKMLQGTVGIPAEAVARMLNIGDKPQRFAAAGAQAAAFAKTLGLKEIDKKLFMEFPREEAYRAYKAQGLSDAKAGEKADYIKDVIIKEGERSTFQQENLFNDLISAAAGKLFGGKDTGAAALAKTLAVSPYIKIPSNAFWSMYNLLNPEIAILQSIVHGTRSGIASKKGDTNKSKLQLREARYWMAHAIVGMATRAVVISLVQAGLFTPASDEEDTKKEREAVGYFDKAGTMQIGNMKVSNRWLGQFGMLANQMARQHQDMTPEQREDMDEFWSVVLGGMEKEGLQELENGVLANSSSLAKFIFSNGDMSRYMNNTLNLFTNIVQPGTVAQLNRAALDEVPTSKGDDFLDKLNQNFAQRSTLYRKVFDVQLRKKRDIWGQPIPKGGNIASRMFGISKANPQIFARPLYDEWLKTNDAGFLPPSVPSILNKQKLTTDQTLKLEEYVGGERKRLVEPYINDMAIIDGFEKKYSQLESNEEKKKVLDYLYDTGRLLGLQKFYQDYPELRPKKEKTEDQIELQDRLKEFHRAVKEENPIENDQ